MRSKATLRPAARLVMVTTLAAAAILPLAASAATPSWHDVKCRRYAAAWRQALAHAGSSGLGAPFLAHHDAFLASNCTRKADVCPRSPEEFALANTMVVLSMNAGTASTFPPFACPPP